VIVQKPMAQEKAQTEGITLIFNGYVNCSRMSDAPAVKDVGTIFLPVLIADIAINGRKIT
jgi:hypothetical protein